jgi:DNA methylase
LKELGTGRSIVIDKHGNIIAGNGVIENAKAAGITDVEVVQSDGSKIIAVQRTDLDLDSDDKARQLSIADNRTAELAEWNPENLAEFTDLDLKPYFTDEELIELTPQSGATLNGDEDEVPEPPEPDAAETVSGEIILLGAHRLMCGDSTDIDHVGKLLADVVPDMVNTDPPYGISIVRKNGKIGSGGKFRGSVGTGKIIPANIYAPVIGDESTDTAVAAYNICAAMNIPVLIFWGGNHYADKLPPSSCWIVWDKQNNGNDFADAELAWTNQKSAVRICVHQWNGMLKASERGERRCHPTQKPVALAEWCFDKYGKDSKTVLDLFGGSGSTLIACEKTNRTCYVMEMSPEYCDVIVKRWEKLTGKTVTRVKP